MATDGVNISEDAEMAECDGDKVVTMMDVLQEQQDFEEDANAVLGASDDKNCTYSKGYIKRQALYACLTCCTEARVDPTKRAGVCLACSLNCHENHELIELYTKRNFRCDCGNPKFNSHPCQFTQEKTELNEENIYNQNFSGLYCTCHRPYPDPESTIEDDMIQCIICEDWLHASHLEAVVPSSDQYSEMVCKGCMEKNEFLHDYSMFAVNVEAGDVDVITVNGETKSNNNSLCNGDVEKEKLVNGIDENKTESEPSVVAVNGDVEMNEEKEQIEGIEKSEDKEKDDEESEKIDESVAPATNEETKYDDSNNVETTESKLEEKEKLNIVDDSKMDLDTENKETIQKETSMGSTETNDENKNDDAPTIPQETNVEKESAETNKVPTETPEVKLDSLEPTSEIETNQNDDKSADDQAVNTAEKVESIDDKLESIDTESPKNDEVLDAQSETQEQSIQQSTTGGGDGDKVSENTIDANEKTEQQLLDDLSALTDDTPTSKDKENTSAEPVESIEQTEDSKENQDDQTNNGSEETANKIEDSTEEKPVSETENSTGNIEVPDTSQPEKDKEETTDDKSDSVMDAIDELLQTANEVTESETSKEKSSESTESTESKDDAENVESKQSTDVEMSTSETKVDIEVPEKAETNDKTSTNDDTEDVEMSDATTEKETPVNESKVDEVPISDSETKDVSNTEANEGSSKSEEKVDNKSPEEEKPEVIDTTNESSKENETENELKTSDVSESTNEIESTVEGKESKLTENSKEHKRKLSTDLTEDTSSKKAKLECTRPQGVKRVHKGATFWPSNFRQKLCTCGECLSMYKDLKVLFLTDLEDTVFAYESLGKENVAGVTSQYEKGLQALSSLDRIQQINALTEYNKMRDKLLDFLKSFKDRKEIVKEEDIKAFFAGMKPRREPDGVYFCR